jgi:signal peptidase I
LGIFRKSIRRLRNTVLFLMLCLALAILLKWGVIAGYTIPTASMEPTLNGDNQDGDRVAVFKLQYKLFHPRRFDLVVFFREGDFTEEPGIFERSGGINFVKRLVGFPGERLLIKNGDLFVDDMGTPYRKTLDEIESLLIPVYRARFDQDFLERWIPYMGRDEGCFTVGEKGLLCDTLTATTTSAAALRYAPKRRVIYDGYLTPGGALQTGKSPVRDLALTVEVELLSPQGKVVGMLGEVFDEFWFQLNAQGSGGGGACYHNEKSVPISSEAFPGLESGRRYAISFMNVDNQIFLRVDGELIFEYAYAGHTGVQETDVTNQVVLGAEQARVLFKKIHIDRDIHYTTDQGRHAVDQDCVVPSGHYFFLGDNSGESEDSRIFGPVPESDLVGRPFMIFYPLERIRFF